MSLDGLREQAMALDRNDSLSRFRDQFHIPVLKDGSQAVYLVGNSLGLQPKSADAFVIREMDKWKRLGVMGHFHGEEPWITHHDLIRQPMADLVGGLPHEVVVMNSLTVNLHLMMATFCRPTGSRRKIIIEANAFPSDRYAVASQLRLHGLAEHDDLIEVEPREGEECLRTDDLLDAIDRHATETALVLFGGLNYYSGQVLDMRSITATAHRHGIPVGFDLAHAVGNVPLELHDWDVDFAAWCTYKYLNAGPGGIAGCFVNERHCRNRSLVRLAGWWGHEPATRFEMPAEFKPVASADGWQLSNPPVLLLAALRASLDILGHAGMDRLRAKSLACSAFLRDALERIDGPFRVITPPEPSEHGCQLSLLFERDARQIFDGLERAGIRCDYREPNVIRVAPVPLYNSFSDALTFANTLDGVLK